MMPSRPAVACIAFLSFLLCASWALSQSGEEGTQRASSASDNEIATEEENPPADVMIDGRKVLTVYEPIGHYTPQDRANRITEHLLAVAKDDSIATESIVATPRDAWTEISADGKLLMAVTDGDAMLSGTPRDQLAAANVTSIREHVNAYRGDRKWGVISEGIAYAALTTLVLLPIAWTLSKLRIVMRKYLVRWVERRATLGEKKTALHVAGTSLVSVLLALGSILQWIVLIAIAEIYLTAVLSFFPGTRSVSHAVIDWTLQAFRAIGNACVDYLPNCFVIAVIALIASQIFRLISMVSKEIGNGHLAINGFYPEWAAPTARLMRMMVLTLVIVVIFPYLPGSKSPAFQGISIFVGVLLSLGSSSAVANAIAGIILTYMRSFAVGDWVKIGDTVGEVEEKNLLVTRILTQKQETITIPNAKVMTDSVLNFTREAKNAGVIFHTTVTIGYDAPWTTVHRLLIDAAMATEHVLHNPPPFVLQTALNDFFVSYELNAYTDFPRRMQFIYSDLHQNIQDRFNEAGVEICSPHFASLRDGNTIAIPARYIPEDYAARGFRVHAQENDARQTSASTK